MSLGPVPWRCVAGLAILAGCQGKSEPDPPRPPPAVIVARAGGTTVAHIIAGHPCRAEVEGDELLIGTQPLVAQVGASRWSGDDSEAGTTLRRDGAPVVRIRDTDDAIEVFDPKGAAILRLSSDGAIANDRGEVLRRAEATRTAIKIGDAVVTGTTDVALGVLITAPELIPEVRGLAACHRLFWREQARK
ncbi:MAG: hypothetical protein E6J90_31250 [Deltaproteobacteria bacterium]|nr:MAG: hypothetical protein E6J90_31250 [Deltaproteobacteria bacterium]